MYDLRPLGEETQLETDAVLRAAARAEAKLGELKGVIHIIPNEKILLNTLSLQEAYSSSEIENIVTTHDELFRSGVDNNVDATAKEVRAHADALLEGFELVRKTRILRLEDLLRIQARLIGNNAGLRVQDGTMLKNSSGDVVYQPPTTQRVPALMDNLLRFINDDDMSPINALVKMAVIHYQFESIHPFYDGNGRTGRILNLLYLVLADRIDLPVLYMSRYIIANKSEYYRLLQAVRDEGAWEEWLQYMLDGVVETATQTVALVKKINLLFVQFKTEIKEKFPRMYSQDLINAMFSHPYTKNIFVQKELNCSYSTARIKLKTLTEHGFLKEEFRGRSNYYVNLALVDCLMNAHHKKKSP